MKKQIEHIKDKNDFIQFLRILSSDFENHYDEWETVSISDFLEHMASWVEDYSASPFNDILWDNVDFQTFSKILYMGKIYE